MPLANGRKLGVVSVVGVEHLSQYAGRTVGYDESLTRAVAALRRRPTGSPDLVVAIINANAAVTNAMIKAAGGQRDEAYARFVEDLAVRIVGIDVILLGGADSFRGRLDQGVTNWADKRVFIVPSPSTQGKSILSVKLEAEHDAGSVILTNASTRTIELNCTAADDPRVYEAMVALETSVVDALSAKVGHTSTAFDGQAVFNGSCTILEGGDRCGCRVSQCGAGALAADALRSIAETDVAVLHSGAVRKSIPEGNVSKSALLQVLPLLNEVHRLDAVPGRVLRQMLAHSISGLAEIVNNSTDPPGHFLQVSATLKYSWYIDDEGLPVLARVYVGSPFGRHNTKAIDFQLLQDDRMYSVAAPAHLVGGGDGFTMLANLSSVGLGQSSYEALVAFLLLNSNSTEAGEIGEADLQSARITQLRGPVEVGAAGCECVQDAHKPTLPGGDCVDAAVAGKMYCLPVTYGVGACRAWDAVEPYCTGTNENWCSQPFCFVDPETCHHSPHTYWASTMFPGKHYSYSTCGGDPFLSLEAQALGALKGKTIRAAIPKFGYPDHFRIDPVTGETTISGRELGNMTDGLNGVWISYWTEIARLGEFQIEWRETSEGSFTKHASAWTACVQDVQAGLLDVCVGNFWSTEERLKKTTFLTPTDIEMFYLLVKRASADTSVQHRIKAPFQPFSAGLWGTLIISVLLTGMLSVFFDRAAPGKRKVRPSRRQEDEENAAGGASVASPPPNGWKLWIARYTESLYTSACEMFSAGVEVTDPLHPKQGYNAAQRMLKVGYGFFVLITVSAYTASLAAQLTNRRLGKQTISNIDDCIRQECEVCIHGAQEDTLQVSYSERLKTRVVGYSGQEVIDSMLGSGDDSSSSCDAFIVDTATLELRFKPGLCEYVIVGEPILWLPVSQPVTNSSLSQGLSILQRKLASSKYYDSVRKEYLNEPECDLFLAEDGPSEDEVQLTSEHFVGPFLLLAGAALLALLICILERSSRRQKARQKWDMTLTAKKAAGLFKKSLQRDTTPVSAFVGDGPAVDLIRPSNVRKRLSHDVAHPVIPPTLSSHAASIKGEMNITSAVDEVLPILSSPRMEGRELPGVRGGEA